MCISWASCICPAWLIQHSWKAKDHRHCLKQFTAQVQLLNSATRSPSVTCALNHTRNCQCVSSLLQISLAQNLPSHHSLFCSTPLLLYPSTLNSTTRTFYHLSSITCHCLLHLLALLSSSFCSLAGMFITRAHSMASLIIFLICLMSMACAAPTYHAESTNQHAASIVNSFYTEMMEDVCDKLTPKACVDRDGYAFRYSIFDPVSRFCVCSASPSTLIVGHHRYLALMPN